MVASLISPFPSRAQVYPSAPQQATTVDGVDGSAFARLPAGNSGYLDPNSQYCRYVTNGGSHEDVIPYSTPEEWQNYRAGVKNGLAPPGITEVVCCRPQTVTLCRIGGGPIQTVTLPYTVYGQSQSVTLSCTDRWGATYTDSENWQCGFQGAATVTDPMADGLWSDPGGDSYACSPSAYTSACTVSCGGGTTTTYDSCGNVQSVNACNTQACCTPNMVTTGCSGSCGPNGGAQSVYDANNCPGSPNYSQACTVGPVASCNPGPYDCATETTAIATGYDCAGGCWNALSYTYQSCIFSSLSADQCSCDASVAPYPGDGLLSTNDTCLSSPTPGCPPP